MKLLAKAAATNDYIAQALGGLHQETKKGFKETKEGIEDLKRNSNAQGAASRALATAYHQDGKKDHQRTHENGAKTLKDIKDLKDQGNTTAKDAEAARQMMEEEQKRNAERDAIEKENAEKLQTIIDLVSSQKAPNPNPSDGNGAGMKPTTLFGGVATKPAAAAASNEEIAAALARLKLENTALKKENADLLIPDDHQTLEERAQNAKHLDPTAVGRTAASVKKHIKEAKSARKGKKQAEHVRREGLRSRTRSQTNSRA